jgi:ADP-ribosylglycohydrolase
MISPQKRRYQTLACLEGLATGDAFGAQFFDRPFDPNVGRHPLLPAPWAWTDDTHMALSVVETLLSDAAVEPDALAVRLASRFAADPERGYGAGTAAILTAIEQGADWRIESEATFGGGSLGNGAAARSAPIGAFFALHPARAADEARAAASVTHAHVEGQAGAIAIAVAAAFLADKQAPPSPELLEQVLRFVPKGRVRTGVQQAMGFAAHEVRGACAMLGCGHDHAAFDTVPFCLWIVAHHGASFEDALWLTASVGGDVDTTCAIVGALLGAAGLHAPPEWQRCREPLPPTLALTEVDA